MRKMILFGLGIFVGSIAIAQSSTQVKWVYTAKKIAEKTYEVHMTASIGGDYHLYAQDAGGDGPIPTSFTFIKNPLLTTDGKVKELGKMVKKFESAWNHDVNFYQTTVDFVQVVKLKTNAKTNLAGKVEFMVCDDRQCLPPSDIDFRINVGG